MRFEIINNKIKHILITLFIYSSILLPAFDKMSFKKVLFVLIMCYSFISILKNKYISFKILFRYIILISILLLWTLPVSFTNDISHSLFIIQSSLVLLVSFIFSDDPYYSYKSLLNASILLSIIVCIIAITSVFFPVGSILLKNIFFELDSGYIGIRQFGSINMMMIHFRTSPILIIAALQYFIWSVEYKNKKYNKTNFLIIFTAILLSASRGLILFTLLGLLLIMIIRIKKNKYYKICFLISLFLIIFLINKIIKNSNMLSFDETSNNIKLNHILSFLNLVNDNIYRLFIGFGNGSSYYSSGFGNFTWQTEIVILDIIRYFGIPTAIVVLFVLFLPIRFFMDKTLTIIFSLYFINAIFTNPLIFNSTGMLIIAIYWSMTASNKYRNNL